MNENSIEFISEAVKVSFKMQTIFASLSSDLLDFPTVQVPQIKVTARQLTFFN